MERNSCIFYRSFYESIKELKSEQRVKLYDAIFEYQFNGNEIELNGILKSLFTLIIPQLEANNKRYTNGCKGGRPKNNQEETKIKPKQNQKEIKVKPNENENDNENDNDNVNNKYYSDKKLNDIFKEYLQVRKKLKAVNSDRAIQMIKNKLEKYDDEIKCKMIEQSILHSWKDVYKLKEKNEENIPEWFNKKTQKEIATKKEIEEIEELIKGVK